MHRKARTMGVVVGLLALTMGGFAGTVEATPPPDCCFTKAIEPYAAYDAQDTCDPTVKPGTDKLRDLLLATYPQSRDLGIGRACHIGGTSEHKEGRAFDWGVRVNVASEKAAADEFLAWLLKDHPDGKDAMARRMGIMYMIWNGRIWGSYAASDGWRTYTGSNPHTDHVHFSMSWDGAMARTSYWCCRTGQPPPSDTSAPETTPTLTGTQGDNGWWRSTVTVKLTATDTGGSGVDHTKYRVDLGAWKTYTGAFALSADGTRRVDYYSVDKAGNQEATKTITIKIDEVPPTTTHVLAGVVGLNGWHRSAVTVSLAATDATSGVAATTGTRDGVAFTYGGPFAVGGEGAHSLTYRSQDKAGNVEAVRSAAFKIDTVAPTTSLGRTGPSHQGAHLYVAASTVFSLAASDATSGVASTTRTWRGASQAYAGPFGLTGPDGLGTLTWRSDDRAGNVEGLRSAEVFLDTTPPSLALEAPPEGSVVASLEPITITAQASDAGSGVARVEFLVDGVVRHSDAATPFEWAWSAGDEALGEHLVEVRAVDHLGHAASVQRRLTTVPTSLAGLEATAAQVQGGQAPALPGPPERLPVAGIVAEADPAEGTCRLGVALDGAFTGLDCAAVGER
jgi:hypothetical protein